MYNDKKAAKFFCSLGKTIEWCYQCHHVGIKVNRVMYIPPLRRSIFDIRVLPGTKVNDIFLRSEDVKTVLGCQMFLPYKEGGGIRIAVSEHVINVSALMQILNSPKFADIDMKIPLALGYTITGEVYITDLADLIHLVIVGPSGTGKSMALQCMILSIMKSCTTEMVRLLLFDIGANSLSMFGTIKHLYTPLIKSVEQGICVLESLVDEMNKRLELSEKECQSEPYLICIIDEFDDTIATADNNDISQRYVVALNSIIRRGRKAKIILVLASHDPTLKNAKININGIIPRIAFRCSKHHNSSTALGVTGAENLSGRGMLIFKPQDDTKMVTLQGAFISTDEIEDIVKQKTYVEQNLDMLQLREYSLEANTEFDNFRFNGKRKELAEIICWILTQEKVSVNRVQKRFHLGNRAQEIIKSIYSLGIISDKYANQPRKVLPKSVDDLSKNTISFLGEFGYDIDYLRQIFVNKITCNRENINELIEI